MKKKPNFLVIITLVLVLGYVTTINDSWAFIGDIKGKYHLEGNENCYLLPFNEDTLILKAEGKLISNNFEGNPRYEIEEISFLGRKIVIYYKNDKASMELLITRTLFGEFRIQTCVDSEAYYMKD